MKSLKQYINESKSSNKWWLVGDCFEIQVSDSVYKRGVTVNDVKDQLKDISNDDLIKEIESFGDRYTKNELNTREKIIKILLECYIDQWEQE